ncbi:MAG: L-seryl-tRNA(Sec) selenium transferase, partial [Proteobacteria bacterium]|nr:L-seryl-tRNA(Sec) selenium transferase [Pseudomonadota bacterium]
MATLRDLPGIDRLLDHPDIVRVVAEHGAERVKQQLRELQATIRTSGSLPAWATDHAAYAEKVAAQLGSKGFKPVFNLTGTIIHTNLGRSLLSRSLWQQLEPLVTQPGNLEYDLKDGKRGDRDDFVEERLCLLTGAEAATIVNNNAAALLLVLNTFAQGKQVPVSRGELIEIGGSFRLPDLMARSGCTLIEVGTTNRTHLKDFEAVAPAASMMLKVHPSN